MPTVYDDKLTIRIEGVRCGECHIWFGLEAGHHDKMKRTGYQFYCPNGHFISYGENENSRLKRERDAARARASHLGDQLEAEKRSRAAVKGHLTRVQRRIANGVCPCCQRSFANVAQHMAGQHPEFVEDLAAKQRRVNA